MQAARDLRDAANSYKEVVKGNWKSGESGFWRMLFLLLIPIAAVLLLGIVQWQEDPPAARNSVITSIPYQQQDYTGGANITVAPDGRATISVIPGAERVWTVEEPPPVSSRPLGGVAPPYPPVYVAPSLPRAAPGWVLWKHGTMTRYKGPGPKTRSGDLFGWDDVTCAVDDKDWAAMKGKTVKVVWVDDPSRELILRVNDTGCLWTGVWLNSAERCGTTPKTWCRDFQGSQWHTCAGGLSIVVDLPWNTAAKLSSVIWIGMLEVAVYVQQ